MICHVIATLVYCRSDVKRGQVRKKTVDPYLNEVFEFPVSCIAIGCSESILRQQPLPPPPLQLEALGDLSDTVLR